LIAEGAQGLGTGNNGRYLGCLEGTESAQEAQARREELRSYWKNSPKFSVAYSELAKMHHDDFDTIAEEMKLRFKSNRESWLGQNVGFKRGEVYRIVTPGVVYPLGNLKEEDRARIIYEGIDSVKCWLPYSKGDKEGNKWTNRQELFICWNAENVKELQSVTTARWQGHKYFLKSGVTWSDTGNHVALKARIAPVAIFDVSGMRLTPMISTVPSHILLATFNSNVFSFFIKKFVDHTQKYQINDIRQAPIVIPSKDQAAFLEQLAVRALNAKELELRAQEPPSELVQYCRQLVQRQKQAPNYLQPDAQVLLFASAQDCLTGIELAVQWEVEKLYGVEGLGPFEEF